MNSFTKGQGGKIVVKFTENLIGDVSGKTPTPVGGLVETELTRNRDFAWQSYSASNSYSTQTPNLAFDGSTSTYWETRLAMPQWIQVDLGEGNEVVATKFRWYVSTYAPNAFNLVGSNDGTNWSSALVNSTSANSSGWKVFDFVNTTAYRYYRWNITSKHSTYLYIYDIELFANLPKGNEQAFTVTAQEPLYTEFPSEELGTLANSDIQVLSVEAYPSNSKQIILNTKPLKRFNNVQGNITISYNAVLGNLQGVGGVVQSFTQVFTPADLVRVPNPSIAPENIKCNMTNYTTTLSPIMNKVIGEGSHPTTDDRFNNYTIYQGASENIKASITNYTIVLTYTGGINP
jgi:hypothetical protein